MLFSPFVICGKTGERMKVSVVPASQTDIEATSAEPKWQTDWATAYLSEPSVKKFAINSFDGELIGLGAYQIRGRSAYVFILYAESAPHSNPTMNPRDTRKYYGIGELLIAYGIKFSIDHGCRGDVVFDAKTDELAAHYERDFHAKRVASIGSGPKRYMLADEDAWRLLSKFLEEVPE